MAEVRMHTSDTTAIRSTVAFQPGRLRLCRCAVIITSYDSKNSTHYSRIFLDSRTHLSIILKIMLAQSDWAYGNNSGYTGVLYHITL